MSEISIEKFIELSLKINIPSKKQLGKIIVPSKELLGGSRIFVQEGSELAKTLLNCSVDDASLGLTAVSKYNDEQTISFICHGDLVYVKQKTPLAICSRFFDLEPGFRNDEKYIGYKLHLDSPPLHYSEKFREKYGGNCLFQSIF